MGAFTIKSLLDTNLKRGDILNYLERIVLNAIGDYPIKVYLFGSWAKNKEKRSSDIDIAIWYEKQVDYKVLSNLKSAVEESEIPYSVEIIDLTKSDDEFAQKVKKEGILWKD